MQGTTGSFGAGAPIGHEEAGRALRGWGGEGVRASREKSVREASRGGVGSERRPVGAPFSARAYVSRREITSKKQEQNEGFHTILQ